jgi:hypothetical protein
LSLCPDSVAFIIATIWPLELFVRASSVRVKNERRKECACRSRTTPIAQSLLSSAVPQRPVPTENCRQDDRRIQVEDSFCLRIEFWRGTAGLAALRRRKITNIDGKVASMPRLGGLHHRYDLAA